MKILIYTLMQIAFQCLRRMHFLNKNYIQPNLFSVFIVFGQQHGNVVQGTLNSVLRVFFLVNETFIKEQNIQTASNEPVLI